MQGVANIVLGTATLCFGTSQYIPCWFSPELFLQWQSSMNQLQITYCDSPHQQLQGVGDFYQLYIESATLCFLLKNIRRPLSISKTRRFGDSPHRWYMGVNFLFRISPRIRIQNQKGYSNCIENLCWTDMYFKNWKNLSHWFVLFSHAKVTTWHTQAGKGLVLLSVL